MQPRLSGIDCYMLDIEKITRFETKINTEISKCKEILNSLTENKRAPIMRRISNLIAYYERQSIIMDYDTCNDSDEYANYSCHNSDTFSNNSDNDLHFNYVSDDDIDFNYISDSDEIDFNKDYDAKEIVIINDIHNDDFVCNNMENEMRIFKKNCVNTEIEFEKNIDKNIYDEPYIVNTHDDVS